jgi:hypothetical protein
VRVGAREGVQPAEQGLPFLGQGLAALQAAHDQRLDDGKQVLGAMQNFVGQQELPLFMQPAAPAVMPDVVEQQPDIEDEQGRTGEDHDGRVVTETLNEGAAWIAGVDGPAVVRQPVDGADDLDAFQAAP